MAKPKSKLTTAIAIGTALYGFLRRPEVQDALTGVSSSTKQWAGKVRLAKRTGDGSQKRDERVRGVIKDRYGAGALLRRLDALAAAIADISTLEPDLATRLSAKERDLRTRITAAGKLSADVRKPKLRTLEAELDGLEGALADAIG